MIRVYSGEAVGETLGIVGAPEVRDVGLANALVVCGGVLAMLYVLVGAQNARGEERKKQQVAGR